MDFKLPDELTSTTDVVKKWQQNLGDYFDFVSTTPLESLTRRIQTFNVTDIREEVPDWFDWCMEYKGININDKFRIVLMQAVEKFRNGSNEISGGLLITAYEITVEIISRSLGSRGLTSAMFILPLERFIDFFDIPIPTEIICQVQLSNPTEAANYLNRNRRWAEGIY